jgi:hypothetical protein
MASRRAPARTLRTVRPTPGQHPAAECGASPPFLRLITALLATLLAGVPALAQEGIDPADVDSPDDVIPPGAVPFGNGVIDQSMPVTFDEDAALDVTFLENADAEFEIEFHDYVNAVGTSDLTATSARAGGGGGTSPLHTFRHRGPLWSFEMRKFPVAGDPATCLVDVDQTMAPTRPNWAKYNVQGGQLLVLTWPNVPVNNVTCPPLNPAVEQIDVVVTFYLPFSSLNAVATLYAFSNQQFPLVSHAFESGRIQLRIDSAPGVQHFLLTPWGFVTRNPAQVLYDPTNPGSMVDAKIRPTTQLNAFYDADGNGLYLASQDGTGERTKNFRYGGVFDPNRNIFQLVFESVSYSDDVTNPQQAFRGIPLLQIGRFRGDWRTAAKRYSKFVDRAFGTEGPLADRRDVSEHMKATQQVIVLGSGVGSYTQDCGGVTQTLPDQIAEYRAAYQLDNLTSLQFGTTWVNGGDEGVGRYQVASHWLDDIQLMEDSGNRLALYWYDNNYRTATNNAVDQSYATENWNADTIVNYHIPFNPLYQYVWTDPATGLEWAKIDPSSPKWKSRVRSVMTNLASLGIDAIYVDNWFPTINEANFANQAWHLPGYGDYLTKNFNRTLELIVETGRRNNPDFDAVYSEVNSEGTIPYTGVMGPPQPHADFITGDQNTSFVPLHAVLYHHLAALGPVNVNTFLAVPFLRNLPDCETGGLTMRMTNSLFSSDENDRERGKRGASYALAFSYVNGAPVWSPDITFLYDPNCGNLAYELLPSLAPRYQEMVEYAARCSDLRGHAAITPLLGTGRIVQELTFTSTIPQRLVPLEACWEPEVNSTEDHPGYPGCGAWQALQPPPAAPCPTCPAPPEFTCPQGYQCTECCYTCPDWNDPQFDTELVPALLHNVFRDVKTGHIGVALANHSGTDLEEVRFLFDASEYGLDPNLLYDVVEYDSLSFRTIDRFHGSSLREISVPGGMPGESRTFLKISPTPRGLIDLLPSGHAVPLPPGRIPIAK